MALTVTSEPRLIVSLASPHHITHVSESWMKLWGLNSTECEGKTLEGMLTMNYAINDPFNPYKDAEKESLGKVRRKAMLHTTRVVAVVRAGITRGRGYGAPDVCRCCVYKYTTTANHHILGAYPQLRTMLIMARHNLPCCETLFHYKSDESSVLNFVNFVPVPDRKYGANYFLVMGHVLTTEEVMQTLESERAKEKKEAMQRLTTLNKKSPAEVDSGMLSFFKLSS